ncbi:Glycosyl hydrolase family 57 [Chlamydia trachomatis]|nr:Glycosyl hydrolase family 57 [Chlamydia trachomatis]
MKKKVCFVFQLHQPFRLKRYRFFDIGNDHYYFDDFQNEEIFTKCAKESYLPALKLFLNLVQETHGEFRFALALSGVALEQIELYAPELIDVLVELVNTGSVELLGETYAHSIASLYEEKAEFKAQVKAHTNKLNSMFGVKPKVFRNSDLIYDDSIAISLKELGFKGVITEGAKHVLGWKSPNHLYASSLEPHLKLQLRNARFTDDIAKNFNRYDWNEFPLTADKYAKWLAETPEDDQLITIDMSLDVLGIGQPAQTGIFDFFRALPKYIIKAGLEFTTPSAAMSQLDSKDLLDIPEPISWSEEEKNTLSWLGNDLQKEAFEKLEKWAERTRLSRDRRLIQDWHYLQSSDHFLYMSTQNNDAWRYTPYESAYSAFSNYMNVLSDFLLRVEAEYPSSIENEELNALLTTIQNQGDEILKLHEEIKELKEQKKKK